MKTTLKILVAAFAVSFVPGTRAAFAQSAANLPEKTTSTFAQMFSDIVFFNPQEALAAYIGNWSGSQSLYVGDRQISTTVVEQNYYPARETSGLRLVGSGKIIGGKSSIPTRSVMYIENGKLCLDIFTIDNILSPYVGIVDGSKVIWVPRYFFFLYDVQTDSFFNSADGVKMESSGIKFVSLPKNGFEGYLEINSVLIRGQTIYSTDKVNTTRSAKFEFTGSKLQD